MGILVHPNFSTQEDCTERDCTDEDHGSQDEDDE
jgi:hypothetical protein